MKNKYPTLFSLYVAQSIPMSFFSTVVPVIMRQEQYSLEAIGLLQLVKLPWILKFLWAPLVDNHADSKRKLTSWIVSSEILYAIAMIVVGSLSLQSDFSLIIGIILFAFVASGTQDIATDVLAIRVLKKEERGVGNGIQSSGSFVGSLFGTGVLLMAYHYLGWQILMWALAAFVLLALIPLLLNVKGRSAADVPVDRKRANLMDAFTFFKEPTHQRRLPVLVFYYGGLIGILAMLKPWLVDLGYNVKEIGFMSGIVGTLTASLASLGGGFMLKRLGRRNAFVIFAILNILVGIYFYLISLSVPTLFLIYLGICLLWGSYGLSTVIIYTSSMDAVRPHSQGTDFTVQIVVTHLSGMLIAVMSGKIGDLFGYTGLFAAEAFISVLSLFILLFIYLPKYGKSETIN